MEYVTARQLQPLQEAQHPIPIYGVMRQLLPQFQVYALLLTP